MRAEAVVARMMVGAFVALAYACGGDVSSSPTNDAGDLDASSDSDATDALVDAAPPIPACLNPSYPGADTCAIGTQTVFVSVSAHQGLCSSAQIQTALSTCADLDRDAGNVSDASVQACNAFTAANGSCASCLFGPSGIDAGSQPYPIGFVLMNGTYVVDTDQCVAAISAGNAQCKVDYSRLVTCSAQACLGQCTDAHDCSSCDSDAVQSCIDYALGDRANPWPSYFDLDSTCLAAIAAVPASDRASQCALGVADFDTQFITVATTMCGP